MRFGFLCALLLLLLPGPGRATLACAIEATAPGRAACLSLLAETKLLALETHLAGLTGRFQGATAQGLRDFERGLYVDQTRWRREMERGCLQVSAGVARARCMLDAVIAREAQLDQILSQAFGHPLNLNGPDYAPGSVEVLVPLAPQRGGFPFLELEIPLTQ